MLAVPIVHARNEAYPMAPYRAVHTGPNTHGGGLKGGWRRAAYDFLVSVGEMEKP